VAFIPKGALNSARTAKLAILLSVVGLLVIPVLTIPAMLLTGLGWRAAPRWARLTLIIGAVLFAAYLLSLHPGTSVSHHG
jgi:hypothetical protein